MIGHQVVTGRKEEDPVVHTAESGAAGKIDQSRSRLIHGVLGANSIIKPNPREEVKRSKIYRSQE